MLARLLSAPLGRIFFLMMLMSPGTVMAQEPTTQATNLAVSDLGSGTLTLTWTRGNGANVLVVGRLTANGATAPSDNSSYTADNVFGSGTDVGSSNFVVYSGTATTINVRGLSASTGYSFEAYEFNTGGSPNDPDYLVTSPATVSTTTSAALILYSYQSGNAEAPSTWTSDSSGETLVNSVVPGSADEAVILVNRTVTVNENDFDVSHMRIESGGTLALGSTSGHNYSQMSGTGLSTSSSTHPTVTTNDFATTSGGTFEYVTSAGSITLSASNETTYNNLTIDNTSLTAGLDMTVNGTLTLENSSTLTLGNNTTVRAFSFNDITVNASNTIATNTAAATHTATITGNFSNSGTVDFTNQSSAEYTSDPSQGVVEVTFSGTDSQSLSCSGNTDFFRLIVDKGNDQTHSLTVSSTSTSNFRIFGRNDQANTSSGDDANPTIAKALWIKNGTLELGSNITLESLTEGGEDYFIPQNGALHINGASVTVTTSSNGTSNQSLNLVGKLRVSSGSYSGSNTGGITYAGNAELDIDGGSVTISQLRASSTTIGTANALAYNQSSGTVTINNGGTNSSSEARLDMEAANTTESRNSFTMSGGTLTVSDPNTVAGISIITKDSDFSVTGGTVVAEVTGSTNFGIVVNGAFNNLTVQEDGDGATGDVRTADDGPITTTALDVNGNLTLTSGVTLTMNNDDLSVGGNLVVEGGTTFTPGTNTVTFDGSGDQAFTMTGTITSLNNVTMNKSAGTLTPSAAMTIGAALTLTAGTFADGGFTHGVSGAVTNSATHTGNGAISLNGTATQTIGGDGTGIFQNLTLNNTNAASAPISTTEDITVNGTLTFSQDKLFDISNNLLTFGSSAATSGENSSRYIQTSGSLSDDGVTRTYGATGSFTWPIGTSNSYTPATINVATATSTGTINIKPVDAEHPNVTHSGVSLTYYWSVSSSGFSGESNITHTYVYADGDIAGTEADYVFGRFNTSNSTWTKGDTGDVDASTNTIGGTGNLSGAAYIDGDFTAGDDSPDDPFGSVTIFYSRNDATNITTTGADWDTNSTWSTTAHSGAAGSQVPQDVTGSRVIIASGHIVNLSSSSRTVGSLELSGTLDVGSSTSHNFGTFSGTGNLIIASSGNFPEFPSGDPSAFLGASGGTVTYSTTNSFIQFLPTTQATYNNLVVNVGQNATAIPNFGVTLPDIDLTILNDLTISDGSSSLSSSTALFPNGRTYSIGNDLILTSVNSNSATLQFNNSTATSVSVGNNVTIGSSTTLQVNDSNGSIDHALKISGSLTNNGTLDMVPTSGNEISVEFAGSTSASITGTGATTTFGPITINKGSDISSELNVNATAFSLSSLTLTNGTFRLTSSQSITPSTTTFDIPSTTRLAVSGGTINLATAAADDNDVFLDGEIEVVSGSIVIGNTSNSNNNDIEYASTGSPTIDVQGGTLTVNGQIRRPTNTTAGNLIYTQSAGTVNIHGNNAQNTRAKLEVANSGTFTMSSGTINIIRGGGTTFNDVYLHPSSASVSGGTIDFTPGSNGNQTFNISSSASLNDIAVTGNGGSNTASLTIQDQDLTINGLTIAEANSTFDANGFGLNIAGGFSNTGTFTANSNTTTFNGSGAQAGTINASTSFHNMVLNKSAGTLTLSGSNDVSVTNDLTLTSGTIEDGGRTITVTGNVTNNATHTSGTVGTGGISLTDADHNISGTGTFGNLTLTGTSRTTTVGGAITLNADLDFTGTVVLDIEGNALNFGSDATITGSSFSSTKMIRTAANNAITKSFPASTVDFTFPIGISTDYTPVRTNLTTNTNTGSIEVRTFDERHPLTNDAGNTELTRYWTLTSTGLASAVATLEFTYVDADVQGTESSYVTGSVRNGDWDPAGGTGSTVTAGSNLISLSSVSATNFTGEYTAGETNEFSAVDTYFSRATGDWETASTWSTVSHNGAAASSAPNGHKVEISADHTVTVTSDNANAFSLVLGGTLTLGTTIGHDFGAVTGSGTKSITATGSNNFNFPSSDISGFTGTHDFTGSTNGNMLNTPSAFYNLTFSGTSTKNLENTSFSITNDFSMSAGTVNQTTSSTVSLAGSFSNTGATFTDSNGTLEMNGTGAQSITASGGSTTFNNMTISNTSGTVSVNNNIDMNGSFVQNASTTLDLDNNCIGGSGTVTINGRVETSNSNGLSGGATTTFENTLGGVTLNSGSTIAYDNAGAQTVTARTDYDGLEVAGSGTKTLGGATTVAGALNVSAGDMTIGSNTLTLNGTVTGAGTVTGSTTSDLSIGGTGALGTLDFTSGGETLNNLTMNRSSSGTATFEESFTVDNTINMTEGIINMPVSTTVTLGESGVTPTVSGGSQTSYINTDPVDDDLDTDPDVDFFMATGDQEVDLPIGFNPMCRARFRKSGSNTPRFRTKVTRGPYLTPPRTGGRVTTNVVQAQWCFRMVSGPTPLDVTLRVCWDPSLEGSGLGNEVGISVYDTNITPASSRFWDVGSNISTKTTESNGDHCQERTITITGTSRIYLGITNDQSPLPITLLSFSGEMNDERAVDLVWETADEINNDFFEVQRSSDGLNGWEGIGMVRGSGNTSDVVRYEFTDSQPNKDRGQIYYRLKQVDYNGLFDYSPVIAVSVDESLFDQQEIWNVFPNPSHGYDLEMVLTSPAHDIDDSFRFRLTNSAGKIVYDQMATGSLGVTSVKNAMSLAASGVYTLEIYTDTKVERHRLIKK